VVGTCSKHVVFEKVTSNVNTVGAKCTLSPFAMTNSLKGKVYSKATVAGTNRLRVTFKQTAKPIKASTSVPGNCKNVETTCCSERAPCDKESFHNSKRVELTFETNLARTYTNQPCVVPFEVYFTLSKIRTGSQDSADGVTTSYVFDEQMVGVFPFPGPTHPPIQ
jgi:hypothetical protein